MAEARARDLSVHQMLTLASIIEKEAVEPTEMPLISAVFWNRIRKDMPLQADPTVQYAVGKDRRRLTREDLQTDSPYNTYRRQGLPPGPIASPGRAAIQAAVRPGGHTHEIQRLTRPVPARRHRSPCARRAPDPLIDSTSSKPPTGERARPGSGRLRRAGGCHPAGSRRRRRFPISVADSGRPPCRSESWTAAQPRSLLRGGSEPRWT